MSINFSNFGDLYALEVVIVVWGIFDSRVNLTQFVLLLLILTAITIAIAYYGGNKK